MNKGRGPEEEGQGEEEEEVEEGDVNGFYMSLSFLFWMPSRLESFSFP